MSEQEHEHLTTGAAETIDAPATDTHGGSDAKSATAPHRGRAGLIVLTLVVLLLGTAGAGGGYFLWQQLLNTQQALQVEQQTLRSGVEALQNAQQHLRERQQQQQRVEQQAAEQRHTLQLVLQDLRSKVGQDRSDWTGAEVEYLLAIANRRLQLEKDPDTALIALQQADSRLQREGDPAYLPVREAITREMQALRALPRVDYNGVIMELAGLARSVDQLPLDSAEQRARAVRADNQAPNNVPAGDWAGLLDRFRQDLTGLVTIRHGDQAAAPLLSPDERVFLRQNLRLKLELARIATMRHDSTAFHSALNDARGWLQRYFKDDDPATASLLKAIERMADLELQPQLPDISASLRTLRQISGQLANDAVTETRQ